MSSQTIVTNTGQQAHIVTETAKVFLWNRRSAPGQVNNSEYDDLDIPEGTVMGRIATTGLLVPCASGASDGSQFPVGILIGGVVVPYGETLNVFVCDDGDVNAGQLIFDGTDDLDTVVDGRQLRDHLKLMGIKPIVSTEMTKSDNE